MLEKINETKFMWSNNIEISIGLKCIKTTGKFGITDIK